MAQSVDLKLKGVEDIIKHLNKLEDSLASKLALESMTEGMQPIADEIKRNAVFGPYSEGVIRDSVRYVPGKRQKDYMSVNLRTGSQDETNKAYIAAFKEYGYTHPKSHQDIPPQPFIRPAYDSMGATALKAIQEALLTKLKAQGVI